jgi:hypothetical protein
MPRGVKGFVSHVMRKHDRYGKPATPYLEALRSPDFWQGFENKKKTRSSLTQKKVSTVDSDI